jgi:hypothetical protein
MEWHREALKSLTILWLSVFTSTLVGRLFFNIGWIELWVLTGLFILFAVCFSLFLKSNWIGEKLWVLAMQKKSQTPLVGILCEDQCENNVSGHPYTSFLSRDWNNDLTRRGLDTEIITIDQLSDKFTVVVNPYGEVYPERDPISLDSFHRIKKYIAKGGIFVSAGGVGFYYCWDSRTRHRITLSKQIQAYAPNAQNIFLPVFFYPPAYSLTDTIINEHFGVNVIGDIPIPLGSPPGWQPIFPTQQMNEDIQYVGNLAQVGGTNQILVFRSATPSTRCCIPFLRAVIPNFGEVYPMAGIPYERGLFLVCGMDLNTNATVGSLNIARVEFEKICSALLNLLEGIRQNTIPFDWRRNHS